MKKILFLSVLFTQGLAWAAYKTLPVKNKLTLIEDGVCHVNQREARRFFFTEKPTSYAAFRENQTGQKLSANCGVIGAAFFWNKNELQNYYDANPTIINHPRPYQSGQSWFGLRDKEALQESDANSDKAGKSAPMDYLHRNIPMAEKRALGKEQKAGTGMGERETNATTQVEFHYDAGMFSASQALLIYYDFAKVQQPNPFPNLSYAPEMPW